MDKETVAQGAPRGGGNLPMEADMDATKLGALLKALAARYETADFIEGDPVRFAHLAKGEGNIEATAFVTSALSYGSRKQFLPKIATIISMADGDVWNWVRDGRYEAAFRPDDGSSFYRLFSHAQMRRYLDALRAMLVAHGTIGGYLRGRGATDGLGAVKALCEAFGNGAAAPVVPKDATSACKRLCLFLRWMARDGSLVDFGIWSGWFDKRTLIIPLDVHVVRQARTLGLVGNSPPSMRTALALTARLREVFPDDPLKGDFALYGLGIDEASRKDKKIFANSDDFV